MDNVKSGKHWTLDEDSCAASRKVCNKSSIYIGKLANEPTLGLYHVQQHVRSSTHTLQGLKKEHLRLEQQVGDSLFDADFSIMTMKEWHNMKTFENIKTMMEASIKLLEESGGGPVPRSTSRRLFSSLRTRSQPQQTSSEVSATLRGTSSSPIPSPRKSDTEVLENTAGTPVHKVTLENELQRKCCQIGAVDALQSFRIETKLLQITLEKRIKHTLRIASDRFAQDEYNGGCVVAMKGKDCVVVASDTRYGIRNQTIANNFSKIFRMNTQSYIGLSGLATDIQTVHEKLRFRLQMYKLKEGREMSPKTLGNVVSSMLYEKRFGPLFVEPVVCGLEKLPDGSVRPYISAYDLIGAGCFPEDFVVAGTASEALYGLCESLYKPDMEPEEAFEVCSQCLLAAVNRDAVSGWGAVVHIIEKDKTTVRTLKGRQD